MSIEQLMEALRIARDHINMSALEISHGKDAELIRAALSQQPATPEPVGFTYQAEIDYANSTGGNGSFWRVPPDLDDEAVPLYDHPAPSVPADVVRDAERYRWLADCNNYEAGLALIIDPKLTAHTLGEKIDAAILAAKKPSA